MRFSVDARLLVKRYRAELYRGDAFDRGDLVWESLDTYETVEAALDAARRAIRPYLASLTLDAVA